MKKLFVLAMMATLALTGSAFARQSPAWVAVPTATFAFGAPATTDNADSCDIGVTPAATLLLPYFEVETAVRGTDTLFTITNTSPVPQIAHVTLWTNWSAPVLDFNVFLTGYDVQALSLYDIIVNGSIAGTGTTNAASSRGSAAGNPAGGSTPRLNSANPNFDTSAAGTCAGLPGSLPSDAVTATRSALTTGVAAALCSSTQIGSNNGTRAIGYATVDVVASCNTYLPTDTAYYTAPDGILYDNVLIGDYQQIGPTPGGGVGTGYDAAGNAMVHIRAVPEGGPAGAAGAAVPTNLPFTFYSRYSGNTDRRQPLPSVFAARYIQGGTNGFASDYKIWREGITGNTTCAVRPNSALSVTGIVRFDEHENSFGFGSGTICSPLCGAGGIPTLPETSRTSTSASNFPNSSSADVGGWMYLNLSNGGTSAISPATNALSTQGAPRFPALDPNFCNGAGCTAATSGIAGSRTTSQNWVIVSLFGNVNASRLSVDFDAAWLANGCTPAPGAGAIVGPASFRASGTGNLICDPALVTAGCPTGTSVPVSNP